MRHCPSRALARCARSGLARGRAAGHGFRARALASLQRAQELVIPARPAPSVLGEARGTRPPEHPCLGAAPAPQPCSRLGPGNTYAPPPALQQRAHLPAPPGRSEQRPAPLPVTRALGAVALRPGPAPALAAIRRAPPLSRPGEVLPRARPPARRPRPVAMGTDVSGCVDDPGAGRGQTDGRSDDGGGRRAPETLLQTVVKNVSLAVARVQQGRASLGRSHVCKSKPLPAPTAAARLRKFSSGAQFWSARTYARAAVCRSLRPRQGAGNATGVRDSDQVTLRKSSRLLAGPCSQARELSKGCAILVCSRVCKGSHLLAPAATAGCGECSAGVRLWPPRSSARAATCWPLQPH